MKLHKPNFLLNLKTTVIQNLSLTILGGGIMFLVCLLANFLFNTQLLSLQFNMPNYLKKYLFVFFGFLWFKRFVANKFIKIADKKTGKSTADERKNLKLFNALNTALFSLKVAAYSVVIYYLFGSGSLPSLYQLLCFEIVSTFVISYFIYLSFDVFFNLNQLNKLKQKVNDLEVAT